jgi:NDP-sugar pyrophosphorylase family protein
MLGRRVAEWQFEWLPRWSVVHVVVANGHRGAKIPNTLGDSRHIERFQSRRDGTHSLLRRGWGTAGNRHFKCNKFVGHLRGNLI